MKIFFCTNTFSKSGNGPTKFVQILHKYRDKIDGEFYILSEEVEEPSYYLRLVKLQENILTRKLGMLARNWDYLKAIEKLSREVGRPSIVIFNNAIVGLKTAKNNYKCIGFINDSLAADVQLSKHSMGYFLKYWIFKILEKESIRTMDRVIVNSEFLKEKILNSYGRNHKDSISVLYKAVENLNIERENVEFGSPIKVAFVKSNWQVGGLEILINALYSMSYQFLLTIIGPDKSTEQDIKGLIPSDMKNVECIWIGKVENKNIPNILVQQDIFCTPSHSEALGVANMEALNLGVPVVYTNVGGIPEVMNQEKNGFMAENCNVVDLVSALNRCISEKKMREEKVENGKIFISNNFSVDKTIASFNTILNSTVIN